MFKKMSERFNFVNKLPVTGIIAAVCCLIGFVSLVLLPFGVTLFNFDIDFLGGTTMHYNMHVEMNADELAKVESLVEGAIGVDVSSVQKAGETNQEVIIKTTSLSTEQRDKAFEALKGAYGLRDGSEKDADGNAKPTDVMMVDNVDPVMGADLRNTAILATLVAVILMLVYISFRFDFKSGLAAIVALIHDVLVMLSAYVIFQIPVNMNFIAAVLTILGYSINATIVVFDRVRENRKLMRKNSFGDVVNFSVWQSMTRSVNTTLTTLFTVLMVAILGVASIRNFAIPICVGVIAGLYSSVCLSGPVWAKFMAAGKKKA